MENIKHQWDYFVDLLKQFIDSYKSIPFKIKIVFISPCSSSQTTLKTFEVTAKLVDKRLEKCEIGNNGELVASYLVRAKTRDDVLKTGVEISNILVRKSTPDFKFLYWSAR